MTFEIERTYTFEAAHWLPLVAEDHKCRRVHGHSYVVTVVVATDELTDGMVLDFAEVDAVAKPLVATLDHTTLNDLIENPTAEHIALWFVGALRAELPGLRSVRVQETARGSAIIRV